MKIDNHNFVVHCQLEKIFLVSNNIETEKEILSKYEKPMDVMSPFNLEFKSRPLTYFQVSLNVRFN